MSIKKSQAILKRFIDLKSSVWFTLGSENKTMLLKNVYSRKAHVPDSVNTIIYGKIWVFNKNIITDIYIARYPLIA